MEEKTIERVIKLRIGNLVLTTNGNNKGRIGTIHNIVRKAGKIGVVQIEDARGHIFATRTSNIFIIGDGDKSAIRLPREKGIKKTIMEEQREREDDEEE